MRMYDAHEIGRIVEIGTKEQQSAITLSYGVADGLEVFGRQRIGSLMDDTKTILLSVGLGTENRIARKLCVGGQERHSCRPWRLLCSDSEEPFGKSCIWIWPGWNHGKVVRIVKRV